MEISEKTIDRLAHLSMLSFSDEEKIRLKGELEKMMDFINKLEEVDTDGVEPLLHVAPGNGIERPDSVSGQVSKEAALANAPLHNEDFFLVPKVIKK